MTYDALVKLALEHPGTSEELSYGTPSVKRKGKFMFRLKEDGESVAIKLDWETHDELLDTHPEVFYKTPHYDGYPALLARLKKLTKPIARRAIQASWDNAVKPAKKR